MEAKVKKRIAVLGATGHQGGAVVRTLQTGSEFRVRALTRNPGKHRGLADEVVEADLNRPETLQPALEGAYGVFVVTNFWEQGNDPEITQATAVIRAAKNAGVQHLIWSTLPDVEEISGGKYEVPHFTNKAKVDALVSAAGFRFHTFVVAPFFYQNLLGMMGPQQQQDGSTGWTLPISRDARAIHMGDITELGDIVAGAFSNPEEAGNGAYLPLVGDLLSFNDVVETLNRQGHQYSFNQVPANIFATFFPGAAELGEMFGYFEEHTYLGANADDPIALANRIAGIRPVDFATWARSKMPVKATESETAMASRP